MWIFGGYLLECSPQPSNIGQESEASSKSCGFVIGSWEGNWRVYHIRSPTKFHIDTKHDWFGTCISFQIWFLHFEEKSIYLKLSSESMLLPLDVSPSGQLEFPHRPADNCHSWLWDRLWYRSPRWPTAETGLLFFSFLNTTSWWFQPIWKILVKLDNFPR